MAWITGIVILIGAALLLRFVFAWDFSTSRAEALRQIMEQD
jgi:hypothetical protein